MNVTDAIQTRRATRQFEAGQKLTEPELRELMSAIALAPSSFNMQNRHVVAVQSQAIKDRIQAAAWNQEHVGQAAVVFVFAGDLAAHHNTERFLRDAPGPVQELFTPMVMDFYEGKDSLQRDEACRTAGMAAMSLMLRAQEMGFNSCPMIGFDPAQVAEIVGLDAAHPPLMLVAVGKGNGEAKGRLGLLDFEEIVSVDHFDNRSIKGTVKG